MCHTTATAAAAAAALSLFCCAHVQQMRFLPRPLLYARFCARLAFHAFLYSVLISELESNFVQRKISIVIVLQEKRQKMLAISDATLQLLFSIIK